jgi:hypothetical protein
MKKLFYSEKEVELLKREMELAKKEEISRLKVEREQEKIGIDVLQRRQLAQKDAEHIGILSLREVENTGLRKASEYAVKAAEQAIREKFERSILELTEKCAVAEAYNKSIVDRAAYEAVQALNKQVEMLSEENKRLIVTLTEIAKEKAHVVLQPASYPQTTIVKSDGTPIQIVK